jgi:hypothetical protein
MVGSLKLIFDSRIGNFGLELLCQEMLMSRLAFPLRHQDNEGWDGPELCLTTSLITLWVRSVLISQYVSTELFLLALWLWSGWLIKIWFDSKPDDDYLFLEYLCNAIPPHLSLHYVNMTSCLSCDTWWWLYFVSITEHGTRHLQPICRRTHNYCLVFLVLLSAITCLFDLC